MALQLLRAKLHSTAKQQRCGESHSTLWLYGIHKRCTKPPFREESHSTLWLYSWHKRTVEG